MTLSKEDIALLSRIRSGTYASANFDETDEQYQLDTPREIHPLGNVMNPTKSRFVPSRHEQRIVNKYVQALRNGWIRPREQVEKEKKAKEEARVQSYLMWNDDGLVKESDQKWSLPPVISAPKTKLPGHAASYNPSEEFLPSTEEEEAWRDQDPSEREQDFLPQKFSCLRHVPQYENFVKERFERCLDLYMCPRKRRTKVCPPDVLLCHNHLGLDS